jgi:hypothetical protein
MTYCLGKLSRCLLQRRHLTLRNPRSDDTCAPSAIRTRDLLLRSNPAVDAVAISDDAGQVSGLRIAVAQVIWSSPARTPAARPALRTQHESYRGKGLPAALSSLAISPGPPSPQAVTARPAPGTHAGSGPSSLRSRPRSRTQERAPCPRGQCRARRERPEPGAIPLRTRTPRAAIGQTASATDFTRGRRDQRPHTPLGEERSRGQDSADGDTPRIG